MAIHLDHLIPGAWESWVLLFALASDIEDGWTIVGGQMVQVLAAEYGAAELVRPTEDVDVLVDVRTHRDGTERMAKWLEDYGLTLAGYSPEGIGHRYIRDTTGGVSRLIVAAEELGRKDRTRIAALTPLMEPNHVGWELLDDEAYRRGSTALGVLAGG